MRWMLCLWLVCRVAVAHADDDEEGGVLDPGPKVQWRVTVAMAHKSHSVTQNGKDAGRLTQDITYTVNGTYVVEVDSGSVAGPNITVGVDTTGKNSVVSQNGGGSYALTTTIEGNGQKLTSQEQGGLASLTVEVAYTAKRKTFSASVIARYHASGVDESGRQIVPHDTPVVINLGDLLGKRTGTLTFTGKKLAVDYDGTDSHPDSRVEDHIHITMEPLQQSKYIAVIKAADRDVYAKWVPLGPTIPGDDETKGGNDLDLVLEVRDKATNKVVPVPYSAVWSIAGTRLPGWCMNYPKRSAANDHWDLYFDPKKNNKTWKVQQDGEQLVVGSTSGALPVTITSRDYAGHAVVSATVTVDGATLIAHEDTGKGIGEPGIRVPKDDNQNHIADAWEADNHAKDRDATDDDDAKPAGMFNKGDGLDVFEEYRGFAILDPAQVVTRAAPNRTLDGVKTVFRRLDPNVKELFLMIEGSPLDVYSLLVGALRFGFFTGITIYLVPDRTLLEPMANDPDAAHPRTLTTRIDMGDPDFGAPQAVFWVTSMMTPWKEKPRDDGKPGTMLDHTESPAHTGFTDDAPDKVIAHYHGSPTQIVAVEIFPTNVSQQIKKWRGFFADPVKYPGTNGRLQALAKLHPDWNLTPQSLQHYVDAHRAELEQELIAWTVMHELGHATGARHHAIDDYVSDKITDQAKAYGSGDAACPMRYWNDADPITVAMFLSGHWNLLDSDPDGAPWKFCSEDWPDMRLWQHSDEVDQRGKH